VDCDNAQTIRLITGESTKLTTRPRHVDIHNHWLRQEFHAGRIKVEWVPTDQMRADSLTKALPKARFLDRIPLLGLEDITERLDTEKRAEELKDQWRNREKPDQETDTRDVVLVVGIKRHGIGLDL